MRSLRAGRKEGDNGQKELKERKKNSRRAESP